MLISKAAKKSYTDRDFDSFVWMKKLQRGRILHELSSLRVSPKFKTEPWLHQLVCFYIGLHYPRFLYLLDMGAGKSKILLDLVTQYKREGKLMNQALITVPRRINLGSWDEDIHRHSDLEPTLCLAQNIEEKYEQLINAKGDISVIDYQGLCLAVCDKKKNKLVINDKKVEMLRSKYGFIGMDECHKLGNPESLWNNVAHQISKEMKFAYGTTGTLFGFNPEPAWAQFYLIDHGETLGRTLGVFRSVFFEQKRGPWKTTWEFKRNMTPLLHKMLQHRSIRYNEREFSDVPKEAHIPVTLRMCADQREQYLLALEGLINADGELKQLDSNYVRMRQVCSGYTKWTDEYGDHFVQFKENPKILALERLLDEAPDDKWVISTEYTLSGQIVSDFLKSKKIKHVWLYGGSKKDPLELRRQFMLDPECLVFLMQSDSGGTGVDGLQKVSKRLIFYETPNAPTARQQVLKRLVRPGQTEHTFVYDLIMRGSVESKLLESVLQGTQFYKSVVDSTNATQLKKLFETS